MKAFTVKLKFKEKTKNDGRCTRNEGTSLPLLLSAKLVSAISCVCNFWKLKFFFHITQVWEKWKLLAEKNGFSHNLGKPT